MVNNNHTISRGISGKIVDSKPTKTIKNEDAMVGERWISSAIKPENKGKLREKLHAKEGEKIPAKKLEKAAHSKNPTLAKEARLAETLRSISKRNTRKS